MIYEYISGFATFFLVVFIVLCIRQLIIDRQDRNKRIDLEIEKLNRQWNYAMSKEGMADFVRKLRIKHGLSPEDEVKSDQLLVLNQILLTLKEIDKKLSPVPSVLDLTDPTNTD